MDDTKEKNMGEQERDEWADAFFEDVMKEDEKKADAKGIYGTFDPDDPDELQAVANETGTPDGTGPVRERIKVPGSFADEASEKEEAGKKEGRTSVVIAMVAVLIILLLVLVCVFFVKIIVRNVEKAKEKNGSASYGTVWEARAEDDGDELKDLFTVDDTVFFAE